MNVSSKVIFNKMFRQEQDCFFIALWCNRLNPDIPKYKLDSNLPVELFILEFPVIEQYLNGLLLVSEKEFIGLLKEAGEKFLNHSIAKHFFYPDGVLDRNGFLSKLQIRIYDEKIHAFFQAAPPTVTRNFNPAICDFLKEQFYMEKYFKRGLYRGTSLPRSVYERKLKNTSLAYEYVDCYHDLRKFVLMEGKETHFSALLAISAGGNVEQVIIQRTGVIYEKKAK